MVTCQSLVEYPPARSSNALAIEPTSSAIADQPRIAGSVDRINRTVACWDASENTQYAVNQ
jgi:hypothetical protein